MFSSQLDHAARSDVCTSMIPTGLWACLPHYALEHAFKAGIVPDRFLTLALLEENRQLRAVHDRLADQVEELSLALEVERSKHSAVFAKQARSSAGMRPSPLKHLPPPQ